VSSTSTNYRPEIGETIFVSLSGEKPFLTTVTGYRQDNRRTGLTIDLFDHTPKHAPATTTWLEKAVFYPEIPVDAAFVYIPVLTSTSIRLLSDNSWKSQSYDHELGYFPDPQCAFDYIAEVQSGKVRPAQAEHAELPAYWVRVEKV
jgi:hypothetical protein